MNLDVFGGPKHGGWSAHGEYEPGVDPALRACPFCGSKELTVSNTHTPYYEVTCDRCGAEGPSDYRHGATWSRKSSKERTREIHWLAFDAAIRAWNFRGNR